MKIIFPLIILIFLVSACDQVRRARAGIRSFLLGDIETQEEVVVQDEQLVAVEEKVEETPTPAIDTSGQFFLLLEAYVERPDAAWEDQIISLWQLAKKEWGKSEKERLASEWGKFLKYIESENQQVILFLMRFYTLLDEEGAPELGSYLASGFERVDGFLNIYFKNSVPEKQRCFMAGLTFPWASSQEKEVILIDRRKNITSMQNTLDDATKYFSQQCLEIIDLSLFRLRKQPAVEGDQ